MSLQDIKDAKEMKVTGKLLGREGIAIFAQRCVAEYLEDPSYKNVLQLAGALKTVCQAAKFDDYWDEQVWKGYRRGSTKIAKFYTEQCMIALDVEDA